jgi:DNA-binding NarL/FixJ family response regulator
MSEHKNIRIVIMDDHKVVADALSLLLEVSPDIHVVARLYDPSTIAQVVAEHKPDLVICDLEMPNADPLESLDAALDTVPGARASTRVLILTAYPTDAHVKRAARMGVAGMLTKHEPAEAVVEGVRAVASGHAIYSDEVRARFVEASKEKLQAGAHLHEGGTPELKLIELSPRELHITRLVAQGMTTNEIAAAVYRSPKTIESQIYVALQKTGSRNRVELTRWAIREGIARA